VGEVHGYDKQGAASGSTRELGYQPLLATRAGSDEVLHVRLRTGSAHTQRGAPRFVDELIARVRRAGAAGEILPRRSAAAVYDLAALCLHQQPRRAARARRARAP
jgi:hypothetical protein